MDNVCFDRSILIIVLTALAWLWLHFNPDYRTKIKPVYAVTVGVVLAVFSIFMYIDSVPDVYGKQSTFFIASYHTIQVMFAGIEFETLKNVSGMTHKMYMYCAFLFTIAPICTFSFVLSFFEVATSHIKVLLACRKDLFVISGLSEKSLILAESIRKKFPHCAIVFADAEKDAVKADATINELDLRLNRCKAILLKTKICDLKFKLHSKDKKIVFFILSDDDSVNMESSLKLIERFRGRKNTELYVFSTSKESELLLDSTDYGVMKVRRIKMDRALAYSVIYNKDTLITKDVTVKGDKKIISALIVGFGGYGTEMAKALLWCGQLPGYDLEINVIDRNQDAESIFRAQCPEIMKLNNNKEFGEARYSLRFYNGVDTNTDSFNKIISTLKNTSMVYVSLGNDELNIETAITLRILFERMGLFPKIRTIVYSKIKCKTLQERGLINFQNENYEIEIIGSLEQRYSYDTIVDEKLEELALKYHLAWSNSEEEKDRDTKKFNNIEYFRSSSAATAIHDLYRKAENLTGEIASITEHMRWNAYMRTEGYIFTGSTDKSTRNDRAKMHHDLIKREYLGKEEIRKDERMVQANQE